MSYIGGGSFMNRTIRIAFLLIYLSLFVLLLVLVVQGRTQMLPVLVFAIVVMLYFIGTKYFSYRKNKKTTALLTQQCDPDAFIEQTQCRLNNVSHKNMTPYVMMLRLSLGAGFSAAGRYDEALAAKQFDTALITNDRLGRVMRYTYYQNLFSDCISLKLLDQAQQALQRLNSVVNSEKNRKLSEYMRRNYHYNHCRFAIENGRYEGAEAVFQEMFDNAESNYTRVIAMYTLGLVYEHIGQTDKAHEAFNYVITHGNKLHAVILAKQHLASMHEL